LDFRYFFVVAVFIPLVTRRGFGYQSNQVLKVQDLARCQ
jgi:hypothetical protein